MARLSKDERESILELWRGGVRRPYQIALKIGRTPDSVVRVLTQAGLYARKQRQKQELTGGPFIARVQIELYLPEDVIRGLSDIARGSDDHNSARDVAASILTEAIRESR